MARKMRDIGVAAGKVFHAEAQRGRGAEKMKPSGIPWIGDIPEGWEVMPARHVFVEVTAKNKNGKYTRQLSFRYGEIVDKGPNQSHNAFPEETILTYTVVEPNTIMINGLNLNYDLLSFRVAIVKEVGIITSAYLAVLPQSSRIIPWYALYLLKAYDFKMVFHGQGSGIRMTLKFADFETLPIILPPVAEQKAIAAYLDEKCAAIDAAVAEAKKGIEEYKAWKKSIITEATSVGLDGDIKLLQTELGWISKRPSYWKRNQLSSLCRRGITYGIVKLGEPCANGVKVLRCSDVKDGYIDVTNVRTVTPELSDEYKRTVLSGGEVIVNVRGTLGGCAIVPKEFSGANIAREVALLDVEESKANSRFVMYTLLSSYFTNYVGYEMAGAIYQGLNIATLSKYSFYAPDVKEQHMIADYLDEKCAAIDAMVAEKEALIADLEAYKKSLIFEVVTGKREVA